MGGLGAYLAHRDGDSERPVEYHEIGTVTAVTPTLLVQIGSSPASPVTSVVAGYVPVLGDRVVVLVIGATRTILGALGAGRYPKIISAIGAGGTTAGTNALTVASVTLPAQGVPGTALVHVHAYLLFSTTGDSFECFLVDSDDPATQVASTRINVPAAPKDPTVSPHATFNPTGTDSETYEFRLQRTGGTGTAQAFADPRYLRITVLWVPAGT